MDKNIVISGMRPTGKLHLGNYISVIKNWISLQKKYECFFFIADIHALTNNFSKFTEVNYYTKLMLIEWLAAGINPDKCNLFIQSHIPEIFELYTILSMITPLSLIERVPTFKSEKDKVNCTLGFLGYPILQGADIITLNANYVPVGEDQLPHLELIREIVRKLNKLMPNDAKINEPNPMLYKYKSIPGTDGKKMSKSKNNTILLSDVSKILEGKIKKLITDSKRIKISIPGTPDNCSVWLFHKFYTKENQKKQIKLNCITANMGCVECKNYLYENIEKENIKIIKNIKTYEKKDTYVTNLIIEGVKYTREKAKVNLEKIKKNLNLL